jgi:hypothetical protein
MGPLGGDSAFTQSDTAKYIGLGLAILSSELFIKKISR